MSFATDDRDTIIFAQVKELDRRQQKIHELEAKLDRLRELAEAQKEGRVVMLPTKDILLESISAADVASVVHGKWIEHHSGGCQCSACSKWVPYSHKLRWCENCGARMDGGDGHEAD